MDGSGFFEDPAPGIEVTSVKLILRCKKCHREWATKLYSVGDLAYRSFVCVTCLGENDERQTREATVHDLAR